MNLLKQRNELVRPYFNWLAAVVVFGWLPASDYAQPTNQAPTSVTNAPARPENFPANPKLPSLFLIGDSTVRNGQGKGDGGQWGWGDEIAPFFDTGKINVVNRALGGTTSRTFYRDLWPRTLAMLKHGDFVIMQFGTNRGPINDTSRARGEINGIGDETEEITNLVTGKFEVVHSFGWYEKQMIAEARSKGATPMLCSLIPRNTWRDGNVARSANGVGGWAGQVAKSMNAPFLDINEIIARKYEELGQEKVNALFVSGQGPHTSLAGAETNAVCVVAALKGLKKNPVAKFLSKQTKNIVPADLSKPAPKPAKSEATNAPGATPVATNDLLRAAGDERPVVDASKVTFETATNNALPTLHIVGDSTVKSGGTGAGLWGWGERITPFFDTTKINVVNNAIGGRSARTYFNEGRWQKVADSLKSGDFVVIQFGTNDGGRIGDPAMKSRGDGQGIGDETVEDIRPDGTKELVHTFGWYMAQFVKDAKAKGATVILCPPIPHKQKWEEGRDFATFAEWDEQVAKNNGVFFFDLTMVISDAYRKVGHDQVETFFADKGTHTSDIGAQFNAACVIAGLKSLTNNPLGGFFSDKAKEVEPYIPAGQAIPTNAPAKPIEP